VTPNDRMNWLQGGGPLVCTLAAIFVAATPADVAAQGVSASASGRAPSAEDAASAEALFQLAEEYYRNGRYASAAQSYTDAYVKSRHGWLLYHAYLAHRDAGQHELARDALKAYLAVARNVPGRTRLQLLLDRLEEKHGPARPFPASGLPPLPEAGGEIGVDPFAEEAEEPIAGSVIGLTVGGGVLLATGVVIGLVARGEEDFLREQCPTRRNCAPELEENWRRGKTLTVVADVTMGVGMATAIVGGVLLTLQLLRGREKRADPSVDSAPLVNLGCVPGACAGDVTFRF